MTIMDALTATPPVTLTPDDFYLLTTASPKTTGLPFYVWFACWPLKDGQEPRIWVSETHQTDTIVAAVTVARDPVVLEGRLDDASRRLLGRWIDVNLQVILRHWGDGGQTFDSIDALRALQPLR